MYKSKILLLVPFWSVYRDFEMTDIYRKLSSKYEVKVVTSNNNDFGNYDYSDFYIRRGGFISTFLLKSINGIFALQEKTFVVKMNVSKAKVSFAKVLLPKFIRKVVLNLIADSYCRISHTWLNAIDIRDFDLIITSYPFLSGSRSMDYPIVYHAVKEGVRTISIYNGMDNTSSKGYIVPRMNKHLVWNEGMKNELEKNHFVNNKCVIVSGSLNGYLLDKVKAHIEGPFKEMYLLYCASGFGMLPSEHLIIKAIYELLKDVNPQIKLYVRIHPASNTTDIAKIRNVCDKILNDKVRGQNHLTTPIDDLGQRNYVEQLISAVGVLGCFTTCLCDATLLQRPAINVAFCPSGENTFQIEKLSQYSHNIRYLENLDIRSCTSTKELMDYLLCIESQSAVDASSLESIFGPYKEARTKALSEIEKAVHLV